MAEYKYRHREKYKGISIDVRCNDFNELVAKVAEKRKKIDRKCMDPSIRLADFADLYLKTYKLNAVSTSHYEALERMIKGKIVPGIRNQKMGDLQPLHVQQFLNGLIGYSDSYVKKIYDLTCQILHSAYINGITDYDYTVAVERPRGRTGGSRRPITDYERKILLQVLKGHRGEIFCKFVLFCGLRPGEVAALIWKDIDFKNESVSITKAKKRSGEIGPPKSAAGNRLVPIPKPFLRLLLEHKGRPFSPVCTTESGGPYYDKAIRRMWDSVRRYMNVAMGCSVYRNQLMPPFPLADDFVMYNLRHTYCTDLEKAGVPINIASRLMGHSNISITSKIYTHASTETLQMASELINDFNAASGKPAGKTVGKNPETA